MNLAIRSLKIAPEAYVNTRDKRSTVPKSANLVDLNLDQRLQYTSSPHRFTVNQGIYSFAIAMP